MPFSFVHCVCATHTLPKLLFRHGLPTTRIKGSTRQREGQTRRHQREKREWRRKVQSRTGLLVPLEASKLSLTLHLTIFWPPDTLLSSWQLGSSVLRCFEASTPSIPYFCPSLTFLCIDSDTIVDITHDPSYCGTHHELLLYRDAQYRIEEWEPPGWPSFHHAPLHCIRPSRYERALIKPSYAVQFAALVAFLEQNSHLQNHPNVLSQISSSSQ